MVKKNSISPARMTKRNATMPGRAAYYFLFPISYFLLPTSSTQRIRQIQPQDLLELRHHRFSIFRCCLPVDAEHALDDLHDDLGATECLILGQFRIELLQRRG